MWVLTIASKVSSLFPSDISTLFLSTQRTFFIRLEKCFEVDHADSLALLCFDSYAESNTSGYFHFVQRIGTPYNSNILIAISMKNVTCLHDFWCCLNRWSKIAPYSSWILCISFMCSATFSIPLRASEKPIIEFWENKTTKMVRTHVFTKRKPSTQVFPFHWFSTVKLLPQLRDCAKSRIIANFNSWTHRSNVGVPRFVRR